METQNSEKLKSLLTEIGISFEVEKSENYEDITINATASDKYVTLTFKNGEFAYSNQLIRLAKLKL